MNDYDAISKPVDDYDAISKPVQARRPSSVADRIVAGLMDPVVGAAQIMERTGIPGVVRKGLGIPGDMDQVTRERDAEYQAPEGVDWARLGGNVANPLSWAGGGAGALRAAGTGAIQAALAPVGADDNFWAEKAKQAGLGGAAGGVLAKALPRVLGGVIKPSEAGAALQRQGVAVTPGQAAGGWLNAAEQRLTSVPVVGGVIAGARRGALEDVQARAVERATGEPGLRTIEAANDAVSGLYQQAVPHLQANPEGLFGAAGALNRAMRNPEMTPAHARTLQGLFEDRFANYASLDGPGLKRLDSELGHLGRKYGGHNASPADQTLADEILNIRQAMREGWEQGMPAEAAALLRRANSAYRQMIPINKAASARADELATPRALQKAAARQAGTDVTRMPADALLDPAVAALGSTVPDSGTAGRLMTPAALLAAGAVDPTHLARAAAAWAATKAAYSRPGVNLLTGNTQTQRELAKMSPAARAAVIAALRSQMAAAR